MFDFTDTGMPWRVNALMTKTHRIGANINTVCLRMIEQAPIQRMAALGRRHTRVHFPLRLLA